MDVNIKRDCYGEAVCSDCEHYFGDASRAMIIDGKLVCWDCIKQWAEDDFSGFMDYMTQEKRKVLYDFEIEQLIEEDAEEERESEEEWMRETMSAREYDL